jgi:hypothetical protein
MNQAGLSTGRCLARLEVNHTGLAARPNELGIGATVGVARACYGADRSGPVDAYDINRKFAISVGLAHRVTDASSTGIPDHAADVVGIVPPKIPGHFVARVVPACSNDFIHHIVAAVRLRKSGQRRKRQRSERHPDGQRPVLYLQAFH